MSTAAARMYRPSVQRARLIPNGLLRTCDLLGSPSALASLERAASSKTSRGRAILTGALVTFVLLAGSALSGRGHDLAGRVKLWPSLYR
jgi:hypothetical protein